MAWCNRCSAHPNILEAICSIDIEVILCADPTEWQQSNLHRRRRHEMFGSFWNNFSSVIDCGFIDHATLCMCKLAVFWGAGWCPEIAAFRA